MEITLKEIEKNLLTLPDNLWGQVNDFVNFLKQKYSDDLPQWQKDELKKREDEIKAAAEKENAKKLQQLEEQRLRELKEENERISPRYKSI